MVRHGEMCVFVFDSWLRSLISLAKSDSDNEGMYLEPVKMDDSINKIIDQVLTDVFGEKGALYICKYLENYYQLSPNQFSYKLELFSQGLEDCLKSGAIPVQTRILHAIGNLEA